MLVQVPLEPSAWRELQSPGRFFQRSSPPPLVPRRDQGTDAFALDVPFGGQQVKFWLKSDPDSPILPQPHTSGSWKN